MKNILKIILTVLICYVFIGVGYLGKIVYVHYQSVDGITVLGYHGVVKDQEKENKESNNIYCLNESDFEKQIKYLVDNNYDFLTMKDVENYYQGKIKIKQQSVCLTFDDGLKNFNTVVKPIIEKYSIKATCFVIGYKTTINNDYYLSQTDLVNDDYVEYYSHSYNLHRFGKNKYQKKIETLSIKEIANDFDKNKNIVSNKYFAFPYGVSSDNAQDYLENSDVSLAFGYNENRNVTTTDNQFLLPRYLIFDKMPYWYFKWIVE